MPLLALTLLVFQRNLKNECGSTELAVLSFLSYAFAASFKLSPNKVKILIPIKFVDNP